MGGNAQVESFIARWRGGEGGAERANYAMFLVELIDLLDLPRPDPAGATHQHNDYVFERAVRRSSIDGQESIGRIDLYRRGCFVLEAKQSRWKNQAKEVPVPLVQSSLPGLAEPELLGRRSAGRHWDILMRNAREQAEQYARALDPSHGWPPFLIICDVGHCIELFADFSGQGKNYRQFPDRARFRIYLDDLRDAGVRDMLCAVWRDPYSLDPARKSATVTRAIARRLAKVGKALEDKGHAAEKVAHFLMRCLFTMFSEDVGLLEHGCFKHMLEDAIQNPAGFAPMLEELWGMMNSGGYSVAVRSTVRKFNGGLFADASAIPMAKEDIGELLAAAEHDWTQVEPAIFGTLLEQALDKDDRRQLGAHYTPRAYVEQLVVATIIAPLRAQWEAVVLGTVERERVARPDLAIRAVRDFHDQLSGTLVLDPACGTGNFLYVALELMKQLEGEVLETLAALGGQVALGLQTHSVDPGNFLGLEINPRAAAIAELVLWLGYLQWHLRGGGNIDDPVLQSFGNIRCMDAVLLHDPERPNADGSGTERPNPRRPDWPQADYIVGNPPFIGGKDLRARLPPGYAEALWKAHPHINKSADFVMYWWDRAADLLTRKGSRLRRFGFVTTNSITQDFSRRVIARRMDARAPVHLAMAIPDHPWTRATSDAAAVRIAMTVVAPGEGEGELRTVVAEAGLTGDQPRIAMRSEEGRINADLTIGTDVTGLLPLRANAGLCSRGVSLHGAGFMIGASEAVHYGLGKQPGLDKHIRPYRNGRDLMARPRGAMVIDLLGLDEKQVRQCFPDVYGHLWRTVRVERRKQFERSPTKDAQSYCTKWWIFGKPRTELRPALANLSRYIATVETAKHRVFQFLDAAILPDNMLVCMALDDGWRLGVLSSRVHLAWSSAVGGTLEDRPRYTKSLCFDPFPFPDAAQPQRAEIAALAEELDATRKAVLATHGDLTLTGLYNLRDKIEADMPLDMIEQDQRVRGRIDVLCSLHMQIDAAVARAYGWNETLSGEAIVAGLATLNAARAREERAGMVRWLRPEYQLARSGIDRLESAAGQGGQIETPLVATALRKPAFPRDAIGQTAAVLEALRRAPRLSAADIARNYAQGSRAIPRIEATLSALGRLGHVSAERDGYALQRAA